LNPNFLETENAELRSEIARLNVEVRKMSREIRVQQNFMDRTKKSADAKDALSSALSLANVRQKAYTDMLLENTPSIIMLFDAEGRLVLSTKQFLKETGIPNFDFIKNNTYQEVLEQYLSKKTMEKFLENFSNVSHQSGVTFFDAWIDFKQSGDFEFYAIEMKRIFDEKAANADANGINTGTLVVMDNLTEFMLEKMRADAANRAKSDFLAIMSHEIRTPLNAILGLSQIEIQSGDLMARTTNSLHKINSSGNHLLGIVNDILDLSKIETGKLELTPIKYDPPSLINDAVQLNLVRIGSSQIKFNLEVDESIPSLLFGDELRLKQILNNILSNAIKYTEKGSVTLKVSHKILADNQTNLIFKITDTGQGIKPEDLERLFDQYARFNTDVNRGTEGAGLGLSITKKLVDMMSGTIDVESEWGKGTTFIVTVKQDIVSNHPIGKEVVKTLLNFDYFNSSQISRAKFKYEPMPYGSVLVVDDVDVNLFVAKGLLAPYELQVETAISGFEAIERVKSGKVYDIIFMDFMMPEMDGVEATQKLRKMGYEGIIVALTANVLTGSHEMYTESGFDGTVAKPIDTNILNNVLREFVRDKYPEEAKKYEDISGSNVFSQTGDTDVNPLLLRIFCGDAKKAITNIHQSLENSDIKLYTTAVHAMKSALANIGKREASVFAGELEDAGRREDLEIIAKRSAEFVSILEEIIAEIELNDSTQDISTNDSTADSQYIAENLERVLGYCKSYDDGQAFNLIDEIIKAGVDAATKVALEEIHQTLYLHSDFDKAADLCQVLLEKI